MDSILIKLLNPDCSIPAISRSGDAGYDLSSTISCDLAPFERKLIPTGFSLAIPDGYAALVIPRSGLAIRHGITVLNSPGLIDSNYRGEVCVVLVNQDSVNTYHIQAGDRIAQLVIIAINTPNLTVVDNLPDSTRGESGFGSSGY